MEGPGQVLSPSKHSQHNQIFASVVAVSGQYCTVEEYIDAKYDLHIFKLGDCYRAMM